MPERFEIYIVYKRRYINTLPFLSFPLCFLQVYSRGSSAHMQRETGTDSTVRDVVAMESIACVSDLKVMPASFNNNNNNNQDDIYGAVIMAKPLREFTRFI